MATLGAAIRSLRTRAGLSQEGLAQLVGLSQGQVSRLERDRSEVIRPQLLLRLASVLGVSPSALLPDASPWRTSAEVDQRNDGGFRVGYWESVWTAPIIGLSEEPPTSIHLSSRIRAEALFTVIAPDVQRDSRSRPLTVRELVRALRSGYYAAIVVPRELMQELPDELTECAEVALAVDGVQVAVCMNTVDARADGIDAHASPTAVAPWSAGAWNRVRRAAISSRIPVYFPTDVGAIDTVHRLRDALDGRVEVRGVPPERWPTFWSGTSDPIAPDDRPVIAVAPEPYLDAWRRAIWETDGGLSTVSVSGRDVWPDAPPTISVLSLIFHCERCEPWLTNPAVYEFLDAVERQAQDIAHRTPRVLALIAERLQLDVPSLLRECGRCDFTTRFAPTWVAQLRMLSRESTS